MLVPTAIVPLPVIVPEFVNPADLLKLVPDETLIVPDELFVKVLPTRLIVPAVTLTVPLLVNGVETS